MKQNYSLIGCLLRRSRISSETLDAVSNVLESESTLDSILFNEETLDLAPDIFPPHLVRAFIEKDSNLGVRSTDTYDSFLTRVIGRGRGRRKTTKRILSRQLRSAAKADATRRTSMVHQVKFNGITDEPRFLEEVQQYFVFLEPRIKDQFDVLSTTVREELLSLMKTYEQSRREDVPTTFFEAARTFRRFGLGVQRVAKQKYPFHGLLYGSDVVLPTSVKDKFEVAGALLAEHLSLPISFSLDFFLGLDDTVYVSSDIHAQQIGFGIQHQLGVGEGPTTTYFNAIVHSFAQRYGRKISINFGASEYNQNCIFRIEIDALKERLAEQGLDIVENDPTIDGVRLFGGEYGDPTLAQMHSLEDRKHINEGLLYLSKELDSIGVTVPKTYSCSVADLLGRSQEISALFGETVFIHPTRHHGFKPFEVDLSLDTTKKDLLDTFYKKSGVQLDTIPVIVMERVPNMLPYCDGRSYPHEFRCYFASSN